MGEMRFLKGHITIANALQDKVGPFCRAASDCALILDAIRGRDPDDVASLDVALDNPFRVNLTGLTLGVLPSVQDRASEVSFPSTHFLMMLVLPRRADKLKY